MSKFRLSSSANRGLKFKRGGKFQGLGANHSVKTVGPRARRGR